jgi:hypothetical protein
MNGKQNSRRTDLQLEDILYDTCQWTINGPDGQAIGFAASLRRAIDRETQFGIIGAVVSALTRHPFDNIIVLPDQIARLRKVVAGRETPAIKFDPRDQPDFDPRERRPQ